MKLTNILLEENLAILKQRERIFKDRRHCNRFLTFLGQFLRIGLESPKWESLHGNGMLWEFNF